MLNLRGAPRKQELMTLIRGLEEMLKSVDAIVKKYQGPARREKRIWNQFRWATEDLNSIRGKLIFHINAINAFTASLSRDTLAQIERVLLKLVGEVREGRRPPSIASLDENESTSVWKELEAELAEDGIYKSDVAKHKFAIRVFLQSRLGASATYTMSLDEVASLVESSNDGDDSKSLMECMSAINPSLTGLPRIPTTSSMDNASLVTANSEQKEDPVEEFPGQVDLDAPIMRWQEAQEHARDKLKPNERKTVDRFQTPYQLMEDLERLKQDHTGSLTEQLIKRMLPCFQLIRYLYVVLVTWIPNEKINITLLWGILHIIVNVRNTSYSKRIGLIGITRDN